MQKNQKNIIVVLVLAALASGLIAGGISMTANLKAQVIGAVEP